MAAAQPYRVVMNGIRAEIESGEWGPGDRIPTRLQLAALYGVSVSTVDRAVQLLQETGLLTGIQGKGVFVAGR